MDDYYHNFHKIIGSFPVVEFSALLCLTDPQGNLLLIRDERETYWKLPGGEILPGESLIDCLRRTVFDKTGIYLESAVLLKLFTGKNLSFISDENANISPVVAMFLPKKVRGTLKRNLEREMRFFATWNIPEGKIYPPMKASVQFFIENFPGGIPLKPFDFDGFSEET